MLRFKLTRLTGCDFPLHTDPDGWKTGQLLQKLTSAWNFMNIHWNKCWTFSWMMKQKSLHFGEIIRKMGWKSSNIQFGGLWNSPGWIWSREDLAYGLVIGSNHWNIWMSPNQLQGSNVHQIWPNGIIFHQPRYTWNKGVSMDFPY